MAYSIGFEEILLAELMVLRRFRAWESNPDLQSWIVSDSLEGGFVREVIEL